MFNFFGSKNTTAEDDRIAEDAQRFRDRYNLPGKGNPGQDVHDANHWKSGYSESPEDEDRQMGYDMAVAGASRQAVNQMIRYYRGKNGFREDLVWEGY